MISEENTILCRLFDKTEDYTQYNHGRFTDIVQPLDDLGYLNISESENSIVDYSDFRNAISQYRNEAIESGFLVRTEIGQELPFEVEACDKNFKQAVEAVSAEELSKLHQLVELEGENPVSVNPDDGFSILELRILRYRASVYGLYSRNGQFDSGAIIRAMERPLHNFFDNPPEGTLELFDNTNNLIKLLSTDKRANLPEKLYLQINLKNSEIRNLVGEKTYQQTQGVAQYLVKKKQEKALAAFKGRKSRFLLRLIQIRMWQYGFYSGRIDGDIGIMTLKSLEKFYNFNTEIELSNEILLPEYGELIRFIGSKWWEIDVHGILNFIFDSDENQISHYSLSDEYNNLQKEIEKNKGPEYLKTFQEKLKIEWEEGNSDASGALRGKTNFLRRVYFGVKSLFRRIWRGIKKIFKEIGRMVEDFVDAMKSFTKAMFREIREGLKLLGKGLTFLFGKRTIVTEDSNSRLATRFDFDCDPVNIFEGEGNTIIQQHIKQLDDYTKGLHVSLTLTAFVLKTILSLSQPILLPIIIGDYMRKVKGILFQRSLMSN